MDVNLPLSVPIDGSAQSSVYDKIGKDAFERIRIANNQLDSRMLLQEKLLSKYRKEAEKVHRYQSQRIRREFTKIRQKKPDYVFDDSDVGTHSRVQITSDTRRQRCLSEPPSNLSYCRRYYAHHFNIKEKTKEEEERQDKKNVDRNFCNIALRLYYVNMMNARRKERSRLIEHDTTLDHPIDNPNEEVTTNFENETSAQWTPRQYNTQISSEEIDNDNVFDLSYRSVRANIEELKQKGNVECMAEFNETGNEVTLPAIIDETLTDIQTKCSRRRQSMTVRRRSSKVSDADILQYGNGLKQTKKAFEKLFSGLL